MPQTRIALFYSLATTHGSMVFQIVTTVVVSRILLPEEVGIYSLAAAALFIASALRDWGTTQYIVVEKELTRERLRAAIAVTLAMAWSLAALILLLAPVAGRFYGEPGVTQVIQVISLNLFLMPFGTVAAACLRRRMNFRPAMIASLLSGGINSLVTICCAIYGFSYMSMAWGSLAGAVATVAVMAYYRPGDLPWLPGLKGVRRVLSFGSKISAVSVLEAISESLPEMIVARHLGFHSNGIYSRTRTTQRIFTTTLGVSLHMVSLSSFAEKFRNQDDLLQPYLKATSYVMAVAWAFFACLGVLAEDLTLTLFGPNWVEIVPLVQIACLAGALNQTFALADQLLMATDNINSFTRYNSFMLLLRLVLLSAAATVSLHTVMLALVLLELVRMVVFYRAIRQAIGISLGACLGGAVQALPPAVSAATAAAGLAYLMSAYAGDLAWLNLLAGVIGGGAVWLAMLWVIHHPLHRELLSTIRNMKTARFSRKT